MKLIKADEAFRVLSAYYHHRTETQADALREALALVPEAVVRCKDCRYYEKNGLWCCRLGFVGAFDKNNYCSRGERRTDETD